MMTKMNNGLLLYTLLMLVLSFGFVFAGCGGKEEKAKTPRAAKEEEKKLPDIVITEPRFTELETTTVSPISVAGLTVKDIESVRWENNRGGSGIAKGTINWRVPEVFLQPGVNVITISAKDRNTGEVYRTEFKIRYVPVKLLGDLSLNPDTIYFDKRNEIRAEISVTPNPKLNRDRVELYRTYEDGKNMYLLGFFTDDGNLDNGDKVAGDNLWSCRFTLARGTKKKMGLKRVGQTAEELSKLWGLLDTDVGKEIPLRVSAYLAEEDGSYTTVYSNISNLSVKKGGGKGGS